MTLFATMPVLARPVLGTDGTWGWAPSEYVEKLEQRDDLHIDFCQFGANLSLALRVSAGTWLGKQDIPPQWLYRSAQQRAEGQVSRNEPGELPRIARTLAALRGWTLEHTAAVTGANARAALPRLA